MDKNTHPMAVLRTACSFLGGMDPENIHETNKEEKERR